MERTYKLYAVVIDAKSGRVTEKPYLAVAFSHAIAVEAIATLTANRDTSKPFGTFHNPLRYEAKSPLGGYAEACDF